jgi:hypothetical protein
VVNCMLSDLSVEAQVLADTMSSISEEAWCAGWMHDLEFDLWAAIQGEKKGYRRAILDDSDIAKLKWLSNACGGWIVFHETSGRAFVPLSEWTRIFAEHEAERGSASQGI